MRRKEARMLKMAEKSKKSMYQTALYHRLSSEDERDNEDNSIGNQNKICRNYASGQPDIEVVDTYIDNGYSGGSFNRPEFQRMIHDLEIGRINCVIVKDLSRFGRNFLETSEYLEKWFPANGIRFIAVNNGYDNVRQDDGKEGIVIPFSNMINEMYLRDTSKKIRSSIEILMKKGEFMPSSSSIPYGYLRDEENGTYKVDIEPAKVIALIFEKKRQGDTSCSIAKYLNEQGVPSPGKLRFMRGMYKDKKYETALWSHGAIRDILSNEAYLGHRIYGKCRKESLDKKKVQTSQDEWQYVYHAHPAIVSEELFGAVQEVLKEEKNKRSCRKVHKSATEEERRILFHKVYCGDCGSLMTASKRIQRCNSTEPSKIYYQCNKYVYSHRIDCSNHYISQEALLDLISKAIQTQVMVVADMEKLGKLGLYRQLADTEIKQNRGIVKEIQRRIRVLEGQLETLLSNYNEGILERDEFLFIKDKYETDRKALEIQLKMAEKDMNKAIDEGDKRQRWLEAIAGYRKNFILDRLLIDVLIDKVLVNSDKSVEIGFRFRNEYEKASEIAGREVS